MSEEGEKPKTLQITVVDSDGVRAAALAAHRRWRARKPKMRCQPKHEKKNRVGFFVRWFGARFWAAG